MNRLRILVVDDDSDFASSLGCVFQARGHEVVLAFGGSEAIEKSRDSDFDITFMDLKMPKKDGLESLREIREFKPAAQVVMMSGYASDPLLQRAVEHGALGVLNKPFNLNDALEMVRRISPSAC
jgi:CheY-like chemotaxis protein